jgi:hypothetical protein
MQAFEIALNPRPERFRVTLPDSFVLTLTVAWRNRGGAGWVMDVADGNGVALLNGIPLVTGVDLLAQHQHIGIPGGLVVLSDGADPLAPPTLAGLGIDSRLYYLLDAPT